MLGRLIVYFIYLQTICLPPRCSTNSKYPAPTPSPHPYRFRDEFPLYMFLSSTRIGSYSINILEISIAILHFSLRYRSNFTFHICYIYIHIQTNYRQITVTHTHTCGRCVCARVCVWVYTSTDILYIIRQIWRGSSRRKLSVAVSVCGNQSIVGVLCVCVHEKERDKQSSVLVCVWGRQKSLGKHKM